MAELEATELGSPATAGSSARSEITNIDDRRWKPRRGLAFTIRAVTVFVPFLCAMAAVELVTRIVRRPDGLVLFLVWLFTLLVLATLTMRVVDHQTKRLLPLATMLRLTLVFPDRAPSRFGVALKTGTARSLGRAVEAATAQQEFATPQEAAEGVVALIGAVGRHDRLTLGHCERVRAYSDLIGQQLGIDAERASKLHWAALLHDVGKLDVPAALLNKKGKPTADEWQVIRNHPAKSDKWLAGLAPWLGEWSRAASEHHERFDGDGYPRGLAGMDISLAGRIVAVADAFDVMTSPRSYKKSFPPAQARVELTDNAGSQFDPNIVRAFLEISVGDLRRVMGPIAWLAAVPELLRITLTSVFEPARTAVVATGVAAAGLVPVVAGPVEMVAAPTAAIAAGAASAAAGSSALAEELDPPTRPRRANEDAAGMPGQPAALPATVPSSTPAREIGTTPPPGSEPAPDPGPGPDPTTPTTPPTTPPTVAPRPPVANDDNPPPVAVGELALFDVLVNDTDPDGDLLPSTLRILSVTPVAYENDVWIAGHQIAFRPHAKFFGPPRIVYEICDRTGLCDTATVRVQVV